MTRSLGASVAAALEHADPVLLAPGELSRVARFTDGLPASFTSFGFECRLSQPRRHVDFGLALPRRYPEIVALARALGPTEGPFWSSLLGYARLWCEAPSLADALFLEFDASDDGLYRREPIAFVRVDGNRAGGQARAVIEEALDHFSATARDRDALRALSDDLPITDVGCLATRGAGTRVGLLVPLDRLASLLGAVGWRGPVGETCRTLETLCPSGVVRLQLDLKPDAKLGFEIARDASPRAAADWQLLLERLIARGLCSSDEQAALLRWPGASREPRSDGGWPRLFCRQLSHLKLSVDVAGKCEVKAYLFVTPLVSLFD